MHAILSNRIHNRRTGSLFRSNVVFLVGCLLLNCAMVGSGTSAQIGLWTFEEYAGQTHVPSFGIIQDTSGNNRHMFSSGGRTVTTGSSPGTTALNFTGTLRDFLELQPGFNDFSNSAATASNSDIVFGESDSYTIEVIATLPHDNYYMTEGRILGKGQFAYGMADEWNIVVINNSNSHRNTLEGFLGDGQSHFYAKPTKGHIATGWHHIALVRNRATDLIRLYIDGARVASASDGSRRLNLDTAVGNFLVGGNKHSPVKPFRGSIDMVRISDTALSPQDFFGTIANATSIPEPVSLVQVVICLVCLLPVRRR